ncbi:Major latex protein domain containing protein [Trema orientale]|uniref:Major latex protein domain containing protein n=1 Tax=Trema orientale TaxID=63057 RepID=A0A2P5F9J0_TREOI|nr:Major latex protein domain containing protein [Trema orientale]
MAQIAKQESQLDIKSSAESFYQTYSRKQYLLPKISCDVVKDLQLVIGDWESVAGSVMEWTFVAADNSSSQVDKVVIEAIDDKNKSITCKIVEGQILKEYKSYKFTVQATDKSDGEGSTVKLTIEYEKKNEDTPPPNKYFNFAHVLFKNIDAYLVNNA